MADRKESAVQKPFSNEIAGSKTEPKSSPASSDILLQSSPSQVLAWATDSTSVHEIRLAVEEDDGAGLENPQVYSEMEEFLKSGKSTSGEKVGLEEAKKLVMDFERLANKSLSLSKALHCKYMIMVGKALRQLKKLVLNVNLKWEDWVEENFGTRAKRTAQDYMKLARIRKSLEYVVLGKQRLIWIAAAIKDKLDDDDPIGDFLRDSGIQFKPEEDDDSTLWQTQVDVDTELAMRKLLRARIKGVDRQKVRDLVELHIPIKKGLIDFLSEHQAANGDVNDYLSKVHANNGEPLAEQEGQASVKHFNDQGQRLKKVIQTFMENETLRNQVKPALIDELIADLIALKKKLDN